jgi:RNA polymerase sigma-70 factor (ECF subfamily)
MIKRSVLTFGAARGLATGEQEDVREVTDTAFQRVFGAELGYVWNALRRLGVPERDRQDVTQDVFVAVHRHLGDYDPARPLRPWLFAFAARCASDYRRRASTRYEVLAEDESHGESGRDDGKTMDERVSARRVLLRALDRMEDGKRAIVLMHDVEGWPVSEIAHALGMPLQTVYSRLRVGRQDLVDQLARLGFRTDPAGAR